jgi:hypothetical protein
MLTTVANSLFDRLIQAFPPNRSYGRKELECDPMPEPVAAYVAHVLELKLAGLIDGSPREDAWVDVYASEIREARTAYRAALQRHQAVPAVEWPDTLRAACRDTLRYLVHPAGTLTDTVFGSGGTTVRAEEVFAKIGFFAPYPYFRSVVEAYFEQKEAGRIDRERFEGLVRRTDRQMTADFTPEQWRRLLDPLVAVLSAANVHDVPLDLLKAFLEEKNADGPVRRMKQRHGLEGFVPFDDIEDLFTTPQPEPPTIQVEHGASSLERDTGASNEVPAESPAQRRRDEPLPLWKQFEHGYQTPASEPERQTVEEKNGSSEPLWKQFRKVAAPPTREGTASLTDLERAVLGERGAKNRHLFVKHLFSGSSDDYEFALRRLAQAGSWSQASQIIAREVFLKHQVNIYSDPAVAFTDAAEAQYRS